MRRMFEIRADLAAAIDYMVYGDEVEKPPIDLEDIEIEAEEKIKACFHAINRLSAEAAEADVIINQAQAYKKKRLNAIERIENDMRFTMEMMGLEKIDEPDCRVTLIAPKDVCQITDESKIPVDYVRIVPESKTPDKVKILAALKAGTEIPGATLGLGKYGLKYTKIKGE